MSGSWRQRAEQIRTIWFLFAMIPLVVISAALCFLVLALISPLTAYAFVTKKHLKATGPHLPKRN